MGIGEEFQTLCENLRVPTTDRSQISDRYQRITKRLNTDFRDLDSNTAHSMYVGSYGRGTAIAGFSDLDMLYELPWSLYDKYHVSSSNGPSVLLQDIRKSLLASFPNTSIAASGQVVDVSFGDSMLFEVLPAFGPFDDASYRFPDSHDGGHWKTTNPKPEQDEIGRMDAVCNYNLKHLCRMARAWREKWSVEMGGLLIDTLAYNFLKDWSHATESYFWYDYMSRDFFDYLASCDTSQEYWLAPGSNQRVFRGDVFQYKARQCVNIAVEAIKDDTNKYDWSRRDNWRKIYGPKYPAS